MQERSDKKLVHLKIGTDMGHYGFRIDKQALEIKEDNVSAYVLRKNS